MKSVDRKPRYWRHNSRDENHACYHKEFIYLILFPVNDTTSPGFKVIDSFEKLLLLKK